MILKIVILLTVLFLLVAVVISLQLTQKTKYNISWIFISLGSVVLLFKMIVEAIPFYFSSIEARYYKLLYIWLSIASAILFSVGLIFIRRIFLYMDKMEQEKRESEKRYLSMVIKAEENERKRLAKDIHDGLGPLLSNIKMSISYLKKHVTAETHTEIFDNLDSVVNESMRSIKEISNNLSPHILNNFGLGKAIGNFINKINFTKTLVINYLNLIDDKRFDADIETVIYRVTCELINNTMKHADASLVTIKVYVESGHLHVDYADDGLGFELDNLFKMREKGLGINNIYSRINALKGHVEFRSTPKVGTEVHIDVPAKEIKM